MGSVSLRPRIAATDDVDIVALYTRQETDSAPLTIERYRAEREADRRGQQWVAKDGVQLVGVGSFAPAWWTGHPGIFLVDIRVDESHRREGIGSALYDRLRSELTVLNATRLLAWIRVDSVEGRRFAATYGCAETGEIDEEYCLHVPEASVDASGTGEEQHRLHGLRILSLAELGPEDEMFLRALQALWAEPGDQTVDPERLRDSFPWWRAQVLDGPGLSSETHWVALDGERPVGMTFLKRLSENAAENDYTGVARSYRGRGIAPALKVRAITWAREHGVDWFYTSSEIGNTSMISINRRLGYRPGVRRLQAAQDLP